MQQQWLPQAKTTSCFEMPFSAPQLGYFRAAPSIIATTVFAPGKLVISGEYAVIDGGPSIVMAIDRGVKCTITQGKGLITPDGDTRFIRTLILIGDLENFSA